MCFAGDNTNKLLALQAFIAYVVRTEQLNYADIDYSLSLRNPVRFEILQQRKHFSKL
jgi:hypothetical protein